ncbi:MAG: EamA family transporter [Flavobacterium sp.]|uniref:DMT family transporter n=1 Tax=Flavobacterium sp. TaxID=239 RepID=UPI0022C927F5|nr:EamA family transporter [Flavobacterium sp.]MCZ8198261.1 EamA family transporter [Flavobacterium sp.]
MTNQKPDLKLIFSLVIVGIVWGTTYLGIRVAVESIPPWFITSIRQGIAALIVLGILLYKKQLSWIGWNNLKYQLIPSLLMIVIANGFTTIAEQTLPSGLTSIMSALSPVIIFIGGILFGIEKPRLKGFIGVLLGFLGVVFIFRNGLDDILDPNYKTGMLFLSIAILSWSAGMVYSKKHTHKSNNIALNLFYQFSISSLIQFALAFIFSSNTDVNTWSLRSISAVLYLAVFGSVLAFFCYYYALKRVTVLQVSILNYINIVIAVFLGWLVLDEIITIDFIIATALIILGVFIINYKKK